MPAVEMRARGHSGLHIGIDFDPERGVDLDEGRPRRAPSLAGMSGSGMWLLPGPGQSTVLGKTALLAGVFTDHLPLKRPEYLMGTDIVLFVDLILRDRPDLRTLFP